MADNVTPQANPSIATDDIGGVHHQRVKMGFGADGSFSDVSNDTPLPVSTNASGPAPLLLSRYLDTNGDGTGDKDAVGDYAAALTEFFIQPPAGVVYDIQRMIVSLVAATGMDANDYGNAITLSNGIEVQVRNAGGVIIDLTDGIPIMTNGDWAHQCFDADVKSWGSGDEHLVVRWSFADAGARIRLDGDAGEYLTVRLNDNFSTLSHHGFVVQGFIEP